MTGVRPPRALVVWCPDWPVTAVRIDARTPGAVISRGQVAACSAAARAAGVRRGQRLRDAQRHCPALVLADRDPDAEGRLFERVVSVLAELTPKVETLRPGVCATPVRGPARYYGSEETYRTRVAEAVTQAGFTCGVGIADGIFAAVLAARANQATVTPGTGMPGAAGPAGAWMPGAAGQGAVRGAAGAAGQAAGVRGATEGAGVRESAGGAGWSAGVDRGSAGAAGRGAGVGRGSAGGAGRGAVGAEGQGGGVQGAVGVEGVREADGAAGQGVGGAAGVEGRVAGGTAGVRGATVGAGGNSGVGGAAGRGAGVGGGTAGVGGVVVPPGKTRGFLAGYPTAVLDRPELSGLLDRLGIRTLGDLAGLPGGHVAERFGADGAVVHRLARGLDPRPLAPRSPRTDLSCTYEFDPPADVADRVVFAAKTLADELHAGLAARGLTCVRLAVELTWYDGRVLTRLWRHDGTLSALAVAERVRWQMSGALMPGAEEEPGVGAPGGIRLLRLAPDALVPDTGEQQALWGQTSVTGRIGRAAARVQAMLGHHAIARPILTGGRGPSERVTRVPLGDLPPEPAGDGPWPGRVPAPAPAVVHPTPVPATITDPTGTPVTVDARCRISAPPAHLHVTARPHPRTSAPTPASTSGLASGPTSASPPRSASASTPASASAPGPASTSASASAPGPASTSASASAPGPASTSASASAPGPASTPASASAFGPASASPPRSASTPASASASTPASSASSASAFGPASASAPGPALRPDPCPASVPPGPAPSPTPGRAAPGPGGRPAARPAPGSAPTPRPDSGWGGEEVVAWAGPWPVFEYWWDARRARRRARFQVVTGEGRAYLLVLEGGDWYVEAAYG